MLVFSTSSLSPLLQIIMLQCFPVIAKPSLLIEGFQFSKDRQRLRECLEHWPAEGGYTTWRSFRLGVLGLPLRFTQCLTHFPRELLVQMHLQLECHLKRGAKLLFQHEFPET